MPCPRHTEPEAVSIEKIETSLRHVARLAQENPVYMPIFQRLLAEHQAAKARSVDLDLLAAWAA